MSADPGATASGTDEITIAALLKRDAIILDAVASDRWEAVRRTGQVLVDSGAVDPSYIDAMLERERTMTTYIAEGVSIPHATLAGKEAVKRDALAFVRFPAGVDWDGQTTTVCVGIAARGNGHVSILGELAMILLDPERAAALRAADDPSTVLALLTPGDPTPTGGHP